MENENTQIKWEITKGNKIQLREGYVEIDELYGAFGQCQRVKLLTVRQIAKLHVRDLNNKKQIQAMVKKINERIINNIHDFIINVEVIDLKIINDNTIFESLKKSNIYTQAHIGNSNNLYMLSFSGYCKLLNLIKNKDSNIRKEIIEKYFQEKDIFAYSFTYKEIDFKNKLETRLAIILKNILKTGWNINKEGIEYLIKNNYHLPKYQYYISTHNYRIDFFWDKFKIIVEFDEKRHKYQEQEDNKRMDEIVQYLSLQDGDCGYDENGILVDLIEEPIDRNNCDYTIIRILENDKNGVEKVIGCILGEILSY